MATVLDFGVTFEAPLRGIGRPGGVFGMKFEAVFEHAETTISKEICTTMSHWGSVPRTGFASLLRHLCAALVDRVAFPGSVRRANRVRRKHEKSEIWASFLMHLCAALMDRVAFSGRNFGAVFEHAKATISKEVCTAMSHWGRVPRAGLASFLTHLCAALVHREAFF